MRALLFSFAMMVGCIPVLTSPVDTADDGIWTPPDNQWPAAEPPQDLKEEGLGAGEVALNLEMTDQNGDTVELWQFYGLMILVDISAEWCAPCKELAYDVEPTYQEYKDKGFVYLTIIGEDNSSGIPSAEVLQKWATDHNIESVPVVSTKNDMRSILVPDNSYPRFILIDRNMRVIDSDIEPTTETNIHRVLEQEM